MCRNPVAFRYGHGGHLVDELQSIYHSAEFDFFSVQEIFKTLRVVLNSYQKEATDI